MLLILYIVRLLVWVLLLLLFLGGGELSIVWVRYLGSYGEHGLSCIVAVECLLLAVCCVYVGRMFYKT